MQAIILVNCDARHRRESCNLHEFLVEVHGKSILMHYLKYLKKCGFNSLIFVGAFVNTICDSLTKNKEHELNISFLHCEKQYGSGGAILRALNFLEMEKPVFILTSLQLLKLNFEAIYLFHCSHKRILTVVLHKSQSNHLLLIKEETLIGFKDNECIVPSLNDIDVYLLEPKLFNEFEFPTQFSFYYDFIVKNLVLLKPKIWVCDSG